MRPPFTRALHRPHVQRRRNARLDPDTQDQTFPNRRLQTEVSSLMARRPPGACFFSPYPSFRRGAHCAPLRLRFSLGHVHPQDEVRIWGLRRRCHAAAAARRAASLRFGTQPLGLLALLGFCSSLRSIRAAPHASALSIVTLRLARGRVAFAATRAGLRAASRPCARPRSAPSSPARGLRASRCHAAARARPGRFRCDSGWSPGRLAALCSPLLRSKLPCARPPRFSLTGAFPAPPSAPRIPACPAAHTYCSYRPPRRAG